MTKVAPRSFARRSAESRSTALLARGARGCIASITTSGTRLEAGGASFGTRSASTLSQAGEEVEASEGPIPRG